ncbi:hypothetical protein [Ammoniphilus sp. YIM 78166]|uniref:hypothetical protein n=1 Tax=Ammoniphilus sp. YIM 78166 TaxID=1644106 RepID=UPI001431853E|nr:hypothetical protein [Ammoniphilus sp. YIM 78166]
MVQFGTRGDLMGYGSLLIILGAVVLLAMAIEKNANKIASKQEEEIHLLREISSKLSDLSKDR